MWYCSQIAQLYCFLSVSGYRSLVHCICFCCNCSLSCWRLCVFVCEMRLEHVVKRRALQVVACFDLIMVCLESFAEGCITKWFDIPFWLYKNAWTKSCARTEQWNQMLWWICFCPRLMQMLQSTLKSAIFNRPCY